MNDDLRKVVVEMHAALTCIAMGRSPFSPHEIAAECNAKTRSALESALTAQEGFVLVPVEPTREMLYAAKKAQCDHASFEDWWEFDGGDCVDVYRAMLAARPPVAAKGVRDGN